MTYTRPVNIAGSDTAVTTSFTSLGTWDLNGADRAVIEVKNTHASQAFSDFQVSVSGPQASATFQVLITGASYAAQGTFLELASTTVPNTLAAAGKSVIFLKNLKGASVLKLEAKGGAATSGQVLGGKAF